jgi:hypothetical protein
VRNKYEESQYAGRSSAEPVTGLGTFAVRDEVLIATFDVTYHDGPKLTF